MSSAVYISFPSMVEIDAWMTFCEDHDIQFSPNTVGQNTFYQNQVQISLKGQGTLPKLPSTGRYDFDNAKPPQRFDEVTVSSFYGSNLDAIASLAKAINAKWDGKFTADEELATLMSDDSDEDSENIKVAALRNIKELSCQQLSVLIKEIQQQSRSGVWPEESMFRRYNTEVASELNMPYSVAIDVTKKFVLEEGSARMVELTEIYNLP